LEYRAGVANGAVHEKEAEMFYVVDGAGTLVTGGKLTGETRTNAENLSGSGIEGGKSQRVAKGDFIMVPENTPHWFSAIEGSLTLMSIHLPRRVFAVQSALLRHRNIEKARPFVAVVVDCPERVAHSELRDHRARDIGGALEIVLRAGRDLAERDLFGRAAGQQDGELAQQI